MLPQARAASCLDLNTIPYGTGWRRACWLTLGSPGSGGGSCLRRAVTVWKTPLAAT